MPIIGAIGDAVPHTIPYSLWKRFPQLLDYFFGYPAFENLQDGTILAVFYSSDLKRG